MLWLWLTVAAVHEVRPDDHLLREAEDAEPPAAQGRIVHVARVRHQLRLLEQQDPGKHRNHHALAQIQLTNKYN